MMRVLVVEDNALLRHHLKVQLQEMGHQVDDAEDAKEAVEGAIKGVKNIFHKEDK